MKSLFGLKVPSSLVEICDREQLALLAHDVQIGIAGQI